MKKNRPEDPFYDVNNLVSAMECTGLMPSMPENEDEDEHYARLYAIHKEEKKATNED